MIKLDLSNENGKIEAVTRLLQQGMQQVDAAIIACWGDNPSFETARSIRNAAAWTLQLLAIRQGLEKGIENDELSKSIKIFLDIQWHPEKYSAPANAPC